MFNPKRRVLVALVVGLFLVGISFAIGALNSPESIRDQANKLVNHYDIGKAGTSITTEEVEEYISMLPGIGEETLDALKQACPITSVEQLMNLKKETPKGPKSLLTEKQIILIVALYDLPLR